MRWLAGFETAIVPGNGLDMAERTGHLAELRMAANYRWAAAQGFAGARDGLAWHRPIAGRLAAVPPGYPVIWSMHHFGPPPPAPEAHARRVADALPQGAMVLPVVEPSVCPGVSGLDPGQALDLSLRMIRATEGRLSVLTGDPVHRLDEGEWHATDVLVATGAVQAVGVHVYAHHLAVPLRDIFATAARRYGLPVVLGETGYHDGHPDNARGPHGCRTGREWVAYVEAEARASGVDVAWAAWMPALACSWHEGEVWPNGWPVAA